MAFSATSEYEVPISAATVLAQAPGRHYGPLVGARSMYGPAGAPAPGARTLYGPAGAPAPGPVVADLDDDDEFGIEI